MPSNLPPKIVLVLSGKGGVGKSSVTLQLALALTTQGHNVGILDVDLTGPSIPRMLGLENAKVTQVVGGWKPVEVYAQSDDRPTSDAFGSDANCDTQLSANQNTTNGISHISQYLHNHGSLHALSLAFLLPSRSSAVVWRGPKKTAMIRQFLSDARWPSGLEYLLVDTPPGTSDEHISLVEEMQKLQDSTDKASASLKGAVIVTTPQAVATSDVRKELNFCVKTGVPVLGVVENMAGYVCPCCGEVSNIFSKGGGKIMAQEAGVDFLGTVPVDTTLENVLETTNTGPTVAAADNQAPSGEISLVQRYMKDCKLAPTFVDVAREVDIKAQGAGF